MTSTQTIIHATDDDLAALHPDEIAARVENILDAIDALPNDRRSRAELVRLTVELRRADQAFQAAAYGAA